MATIAGAMLATDARASEMMVATLSGMPSSPVAERTVRPRDGISVRFRAPAAVRLATVWSHWRHADATCSATLYADDGGGLPGDALGAPQPIVGDGWVPVAFDLGLLAGERYHVVFACAPASWGRLTYVLDTEIADNDVWALLDLGRGGRRRSARATPLFALRFADDTWWGQPYRSPRGRAPARLCGSGNLRQSVVLTKPLLVSDVHLTVDRDSVPVDYSISTTDADGAAGPMVLSAGTRYRVRLRAEPGTCVRPQTLATDLQIGRPFAGIAPRGLEASSDRGATWHPVDGSLAVALVADPVAPPAAVCGDGVVGGTEACDGAADAACPGRCTASCSCAAAPSCGDGAVNGDEQCDGAADTACPGRCTASCTCTPPPSVCGDGIVGGTEACDGLSDSTCPGRCTAACTCAAPPPVCGDGIVNGNEQCDGAADAACPGRCTQGCACAAPPPPPGCGNGQLNAGEQCDGANDAACPGRCRSDCTCAPLPVCGDGIVNGSEACDGASSAACPAGCKSDCTCADPTPPTRSYKSIYGSGYLGVYDSSTISLWPSRLGLILGGADVQGPMIKSAKQQAASAGNTDAIFAFYLSLTDMDSRCDCLDQRLYDSFRGNHPDWILKNSSGGMVSTNNGIGRLFATDIGNLAYIDAWADFALAEVDRHGWDGVWADNIFRGYFGEWSAQPYNPRTGQPYTTADYRADMLRALKRLRERFHARGKLFIGNHVQTWQPDVFADPIQREAITTMDGVEIEDCVFSYGGSRAYSESDVIAQLKYLDYANKNGVMSICRAFTTDSREYPLAFYMLTKEGFSQIAQLNGAGQWKSDMTTNLGTASGGFYCLDPSNGMQRTSNCPSAGKVLGRDFAKGRVLVNASASATYTVSLGATFQRGGSAVSSVTLGPRSGAVLTR